MNNLILSIFPGIDLLGRAFEEEGYCVVRGPDLLWGDDIRGFHPPAGVFEGVIGGPPCQIFSQLIHLAKAQGHDVRHGNLIPEFARVVRESLPFWFLMENVKQAPNPDVTGYQIQTFHLNTRWLGQEQNRLRKFWFGSKSGQLLNLEVSLFEVHDKATTILASSGGKLRPTQKRGIPIDEMCRLQGLPNDILKDSPFTIQGKRQVIGNAVPMPMGRAIAKAVKRALE